jgi:hypothetical protein
VRLRRGGVAVIAGTHGENGMRDRVHDRRVRLGADARLTPH